MSIRWLESALQWFKDYQVPFKEPLVPPDFYTAESPPENNIVWILRKFDQSSRLYRMIQYIHTQYGVKQTVIVPRRTVSAEFPVLEFYQKTEAAIAIHRSTYIFSEAGVMESAVVTGKRSARPVYLFIHDESSDAELKRVLPMYKDVYIFYTSKWIQTVGEWANRASLQVYLPVFAKEHVTHTTKKVVLCLCKDSQWKFQSIASTLPAQEFMYSPTGEGRNSLYLKTAVLCVLNTATPYEIIMESAASGIPIVVQWSPIYEEVFGDDCVYIKKDSVDDWTKIISLLMGNALFYREQSQKSLRLSQSYDSSKEMDMFLNHVFSEVINL